MPVPLNLPPGVGSLGKGASTLPLEAEPASQLGTSNTLGGL